MKKKKRPITLIELLVVITLIGIIGGALAFNMKGSLDKGKSFKREENIRVIKDVLELELAKGRSTTDVKENWEKILRDSPLIAKPDDLISQYIVTLKNDDTFDVQAK